MENQHLLEDILRENMNKLKDYIQKNDLEAYRIFNHDHLAFPITIDIYGQNAVVHVYETIDEQTIIDVESALKNAVQIFECFWKSKAKNEIQLPKSPKKEIIVREYGCKFLINLSDYLDTGLFLDHRETRKWIQSISKGKTIANTFAYTGTFSIHAAIGGAKRTYSVDLSKTYGQWTKTNLEYNNLSTEDNWVINMDTFEFFRYALKKNLLFDIIIIDPPTFSRNKTKHFHVQKDHPELIKEALKVLAPEGFIMFSNNYQDFEMDSEILESCKVVAKNDTIAPDFKELSPHHAFIISHK